MSRISTCRMNSVSVLHHKWPTNGRQALPFLAVWFLFSAKNDIQWFDTQNVVTDNTPLSWPSPYWHLAHKPSFISPISYNIITTGCQDSSDPSRSNLVAARRASMNQTSLSSISYKCLIELRSEEFKVNSLNSIQEQRLQYYPTEHNPALGIIIATCTWQVGRVKVTSRWIQDPWFHNR